MRRKLGVLLVAMLVIWMSQALAVSVTVSNGMIVQTYLGSSTPTDTAAMGRIVLDGDVTDYITSAETGKILGKVTCSVPTKNSFAGIAFTNVTGGTRNGTITRFTGVPETGDPAAVYRCRLNSAPENMPVYYVVRQNGANVTADVSFAFESPGLITPNYSLKRWLTDSWQDYGTGNASSPITATAVLINQHASLAHVWIGVHYVGIPRVYARVFFEGNWDIFSAAQDPPIYKMNWYQDYQNVVATQLLDPYGVLTNPIPQLPTLPNGRLIDWIHVMLRQTANGAYVAKSVGFIDEFGYLYDINGEAGIPVNIPHGYYYIVINHHNHLPVQSNNAVLTDTLTGYGPNQKFHDFTKPGCSYDDPDPSITDPPQCHLYKYDPVGQRVIPIQPPIYGLWAGNNRDELMLPGQSQWVKWWEYTSQVRAQVTIGEDRSLPQNENLLPPHYTRADHNLSGYVLYDDVNPPQNNNLRIANVPLTP